MAFTFVLTAEQATGSGTSMVINKPTGTADGDVMFAIMHSNSALPNSVPSGWNLVNSTNVAGRRCALYYKVAASEGASYTWGFAASQAKKGVIATYRGGFNSASVIDQSSAVTYTTSDTTVRGGTITVTSANSPLLFFGTVDEGTSRTYTKPTVPTSGWVEDYDSWDATSQKGISIDSMVWASNGATGNADATLSAASTGKQAFLVSLNPPSSPSKLALLGVG